MSEIPDEIVQEAYDGAFLILDDDMIDNHHAKAMQTLRRVVERVTLWAQEQARAELAAAKEANTMQHRFIQEQMARATKAEAELAAEREAHERMWANWEATRLEYDQRLNIAEAELAAERERANDMEVRLDRAVANFNAEVAKNAKLREALERAERKLTAYVGVCKDDKELTDAVLPMARAALAETGGDSE